MTPVKKKNNRGFVLLYAMIVASVVLIVGLSLSNIIFKQILISSIGRSSQRSYYAADTGRECVIYGSIHGIIDKIFKEGGGSIDCGSGNIPVSFTTLPSGNSEFSFGLSSPVAGEVTCTEVLVEKTGERFVAFSQGYNSDCESVSGDNPRIVERSIRTGI